MPTFVECSMNILGRQTMPTGSIENKLVDTGEDRLRRVRRKQIIYYQAINLSDLIDSYLQGVLQYR